MKETESIAVLTPSGNIEQWNYTNLSRNDILCVLHFGFIHEATVVLWTHPQLLKRYLGYNNLVNHLKYKVHGQLFKVEMAGFTSEQKSQIKDVTIQIEYPNSFTVVFGFLIDKETNKVGPPILSNIDKDIFLQEIKK